VKRISWLGLLVVVLGISAPAQAYIGPGAGMSAIGTLVAFLGAVAFAIFGFVWYPLKRLRAKLFKRKAPETRTSENRAEDDEIEPAR
jgi:hypothetical protein